jgi:calcineurin-like phosphoesterase family protein
MDRRMTELWNDTVTLGDEVWHLGDFAVRQPPERGRAAGGAERHEALGGGE